MLKGIYKEFVTVKIKGNPIYDEAIFILKQNSGKLRDSKSDDLCFEANRILCESGIKHPKRKSKTVKRLIFSILLVLFGAIIGFGIAFLLLYFGTFGVSS